MNTAWLQKAFVELAGKSSEEAQEILRNWVTTRILTMGDYNELADRLTAAYLERDARRAANLKDMPRIMARSKTGSLPAPGEKGPRSKTAKLPPLPGAEPGKPAEPAEPAGKPSDLPPGPPSAAARPLDPDSPLPAPGTRPLRSGYTQPLGDRFRSRPPGGS